jgi:hypothetical protein
VPITIKVVSSNPIHGKVYSIQHYVIKFVSDLQQVSCINFDCSIFAVHSEVYSIQHYVIKFVSSLQWFSPGTPVSSTNKTNLHDITELLLKVPLNTITLILFL